MSADPQKPSEKLSHIALSGLRRLLTAKRQTRQTRALGFGWHRRHRVRFAQWSSRSTAEPEKMSAGPQQPLEKLPHIALSGLRRLLTAKRQTKQTRALGFGWHRRHRVRFAQWSSRSTAEPEKMSATPQKPSEK